MQLSTSDSFPNKIGFANERLILELGGGIDPQISKQAGPAVAFARTPPALDGSR